MKVITPNSVQKTELVVDANHLKVFKSGVLLFFTWQLTATAAAASFTDVTITNTDNTTCTMRFNGPSFGTAPFTYMQFELPLVYKSISYTEI
jgi:hypothetical protein